MDWDGIEGDHLAVAHEVLSELRPEVEEAVGATSHPPRIQDAAPASGGAAP